MSKELGLPLRFPGKPGAYDRLLEMTDAGLLAQGHRLGGDRRALRNQAFNITNGDLFRWNEMWPKIAALLRPGGGAAAADVARSRHGRQGAALERMSREARASRHPYEDVSSWRFGDFVFGWDYDMFADGTKARRFGFHEYVETEAMFLGVR